MSAYNNTYYYNPGTKRLTWLEVDSLGRNDIFPPRVADSFALDMDEARRVVAAYGGALLIGTCKSAEHMALDEEYRQNSVEADQWSNRLMYQRGY